MRHRREPRERREPEASGDRLIYGLHPVEEALAVATRPRALYLERGKHEALAASARAARVRVEQVPRDTLAELCGSPHHQGAVLVLAPYEYADLFAVVDHVRALGVAPLLLFLDGITDPQNLGACVRSAYLFGAHAVVVPRDRAAQVTPAVVKASAGATERMAVAQVTNLSRTIEELKGLGVWSVAAVAPRPEAGERPPQAPWEIDLATPSALVVGAEGAGVRPLVARTCDLRTTIPMEGEGVGSLNASAAAAVLLYEARRQRLLAAT